MAHIKIALFALVLAAPFASAASFNCAKAVTAVEKMVCADPDLSREDDHLNGSYKRAVERVGNKPAMREWQRAWLRSAALTACKTTACVKEAYGTRVKLLDDAVKSPWNGHYVRYYEGKPDRHSADIVLIESVEGGVIGEGSTTWLGPNAANGQVHEGSFSTMGKLAGKSMVFNSEDCRLTMTLKGILLKVTDNNQCGGVNATFTGDYRRK